MKVFNLFNFCQITDPKQGLERKILITGLNDTRVKAYYDFMVDIAVIFGAKKREARNQLKRSLKFEIEVAKVKSKLLRMLSITVG